MKNYILVIDEGTTGTRALIFDRQFNIVANSYTEFTQYTPAENMVEHDAEEIYEKSVVMCKSAMEKANIIPEEIAAIGITNQRATYTFWDKNTGKPIHRAVVWQDNRVADIVDDLRANNTALFNDIVEHCGKAVVSFTAVPVTYWLCQNVPGFKERLDSGDVLIGTIDTWLVWKLTEGRVHAIASSNASATGCYDIVKHEWYQPFFEAYGLSSACYPVVKNEADDYGYTTVLGGSIPIRGVIADQQSALYAQGCHTPGTVKCTNGTGTFLDINIGHVFKSAPGGLDGGIAWTLDGQTTYLYEGLQGVTGSAIQWLRDGLQIIETSPESEAIARSVPDTNGVYFVTALTGTNMPVYDPYARGLIAGISRGTTRAHIVRATLESIALGLADIMEAVHANSGIKIQEIKIDGGASKNNLLAQMMADYINATIYRPASVEATSLGAAQMAMLGAGLAEEKDFENALVLDRVFKPEITPEQRANTLMMWHRATKRAHRWLLE